MPSLRALLSFVFIFLLTQIGSAEESPRLSLEVQAALQQGRKFLQAGEFSSAVRVLEASASLADHDVGYQRLLAQAYEAYLNELVNTNRRDLETQVRVKLDQLRKQLPPAISPVRGSEGKQKTSVAHSAVLVRAQQAEEVVVAVEVGQLLGRADRLFLAEKYLEAQRCYQDAYRQHRELPELSRERWAYCKLHKVAQQLNEGADATLDFVGLEQEVKDALALAPRFEFGERLLGVIQTRSGAKATSQPAVRPEVAAVAVQHLQGQGSWQIAESLHFRLYHQNKQLSERVLAIAERTRDAVMQKWFGGRPDNEWNSKCDIFLYPNGQTYSQATGAPPESPGHTSISADNQDARRVQHRRVDLRQDHDHLLVAVLPHEVTHAVLAGQISHVPIPRWADEGMAVLSETYERIGRHLAPLPQTYMEGRAFTAAQLMNQDDYPDPSRMPAFYGQGVCLVQFLVQQKGPEEFVAFLRSSATEGYDSALRRHYGMTMGELDQRLERFIVHERVPSLNVANR